MRRKGRGEEPGDSFGGLAKGAEQAREVFGLPALGEALEPELKVHAGLMRRHEGGAAFDGARFVVEGELAEGAVAVRVDLEGGLPTLARHAREEVISVGETKGRGGGREWIEARDEP